MGCGATGRGGVADWWGGAVLDIMHGRSSRVTIDPRIPYNAGTEHVGFSPTRQTLLAPNAKHHEMLVELREGCAVSY